MAELLYESYYGVSNMEDDVITHHGIKGQKWGTRRWQNEDMSLTPAGRVHYGVGEGRGQKKYLTKEEKDAARAERKEERAKRREERSVLKAERKAEKESEREAKKAEDLEKRKAKIIADADPETIVKNRAILSTAEFNEAYNRATLAKKTSDLIVPKERKIDKIINVGTKVADTMKMINNVKEQRDKLFGLDEKKKLALEIAKEARAEQREIAKEQRAEQREIRKELRGGGNKKKDKNKSDKDGNPNEGTSNKSETTSKKDKSERAADWSHMMNGVPGFDSYSLYNRNGSGSLETRWATNSERRADARSRKAGEEVARERAILDAKRSASESKSLLSRVSSMTSVTPSLPKTVSLDKPISVVQRNYNYVDLKSRDSKFVPPSAQSPAKKLSFGKDYDSIFQTPVKSLSATWAPEPDEKKKKRGVNLSLYGL